MKRYLWLLIFFSSFCHAQGTGVVTGAINDTSSIGWIGASVTFTLTGYTGGQPINIVTGLPVSTRIVSTANITGNFSATLTRNDNIVPTGTQWKTTICVANSQWTNPYNGNNQCQDIQSFTLASSSLNISNIITSSNFSPFTISPGFQLPISHNGSIGQPSLVGNLYYDVIQHSLFIDDPILGYIPASSNSGGLITTGILGDYFLDAGSTNPSTTVVKDYSGANNDGNFISGHSPSWTYTGLKFATTPSPQGVLLPQSVSSAKTIEIAAYFNPIPNINGIFITNQYPTILQANEGSSGTNLTIASSVYSPYYLGVNSSGSQKTNASNFFTAGFHVVTFVLGTGSGNLDHLYVDGVEVPYSNQGSSFHSLSSGYCLGACYVSPFLTSGFNGVMYRARFLSDQLTSDQISSDSQKLKQWVSQKGVSVTPSNTVLSNPTIIGVGDSITCAFNVTSCNTTGFSWLYRMTLINQPTYTINNFAVAGSYAQEMASSVDEMGGAYCKTMVGPSNALIMAGTNDVSHYSVAQSMTYIISLVQQYKQKGCNVFVGSILSNGNSTTAPGNPTANQQKNDFNQQLSSIWKTIGADGFIDFASDPLIGADNANSNTTYFQADKVHPTAAGQLLMANAASNALNYYYSKYNYGFPNIITTAPYTMAVTDRAVNWAPLSNLPITLPSCIGLTGATFWITNIGVDATIAVPAGSYINGSTSPLSIKANTTVVLQVTMPGGYSSPKCQWITK